jgi:hypothetical protein
MGYRIKLGRIPKTEKEQYKGKTEEEVYKMLGDDEFSSYRPPNHEELFEIGKYVSYENGRSPFYDFEMEDTEFDILSKEGLLSIIEETHKELADYFFEMNEAIVNVFEKIEKKEELDFYTVEGFDKVVSHLRSKAVEWKNEYRLKPYRLEENKKMDGYVSSSWLKEYSIFNLAHIYRTFDWENDYLIYSGW